MVVRKHLMEVLRDVDADDSCVLSWALMMGLPMVDAGNRVCLYSKKRFSRLPPCLFE